MGLSMARAGGPSLPCSLTGRQTIGLPGQRDMPCRTVTETSIQSTTY
jgi:hypothetical protein